MNRKKIKDYSKNIAKSLGYSAITVIGNSAPTAKDFVANNRDMYLQSYDFFVKRLYPSTTFWTLIESILVDILKG